MPNQSHTGKLMAISYIHLVSWWVKLIHQEISTIPINMHDKIISSRKDFPYKI
jgi:hypothetical protein